MEPHERLLPYLNRSRTFQQYSTLPSILTPPRHLSISEQSVQIVQPPTTLITEPLSSSDSNLFRRRPTTTAIPASLQKNISTRQKKEMTRKL